jgi:1-acyl-sn-glycerol-3-phosphate acyltransferase
MEPTDINWKRRAITTPFWFGSAIGLSLTLPLWLPVTLALDLFARRSWSITRTLLYFTFFFSVESLGLVWGFALWLLRPIFYREKLDYWAANRVLQRWWSWNLFFGAVRIFGVKLDVQGLEDFENPKPAIALCRHASTLDTMLPLAIVREAKNMRYVIKSELLASPALDYIAQRFPNVFVRRGSADPEAEIQRVVELGQNLMHNGCVVIYPEGTRFSAKKRDGLREKFTASGNRLLPVANILERTLPPLREGAVRLIEESVDDVVFIAHRGIDRTGGMHDLFAGTLTHAHLEVAIWRIPAEEVPRERAAAERFILENWLKIDAWAQGKTLDESVPVEQLVELAPELDEPVTLASAS